MQGAKHKLTFTFQSGIFNVLYKQNAQTEKKLKEPQWLSVANFPPLCEEGGQFVCASNSLTDYYACEIIMKYLEK